MSRLLTVRRMVPRESDGCEHGSQPAEWGDMLTPHD